MRNATLTHLYHETVGHYFVRWCPAILSSLLSLSFLPSLSPRNILLAQCACSRVRRETRARVYTTVVNFQSNFITWPRRAGRWPVCEPSFSPPQAGDGGQHYCCTVVHCQGRKMETRGRGIINDCPFTVSRPGLPRASSRLLFFIFLFFPSFVTVYADWSRELNLMMRKILNYRYTRVKREWGWDWKLSAEMEVAARGRGKGGKQ